MGNEQTTTKKNLSLSIDKKNQILPIKNDKGDGDGDGNVNSDGDGDGDIYNSDDYNNMEGQSSPPYPIMSSPAYIEPEPDPEPDTDPDPDPEPDPTLNPDDDFISSYKDMDNIQNKINDYKRTIKKYWIINSNIIYIPWAAKYIKYECRTLPPNLTGVNGFVWQGNKYQYDLRSLKTIEKRIVAWRTPFIKHPLFNDTNGTLSHLCHNSECYNWHHHTFEHLNINKSRNGCPGLERCCHKVKCIRPGEYHDK